MISNAFHYGFLCFSKSSLHVDDASSNPAPSYKTDILLFPLNNFHPLPFFLKFEMLLHLAMMQFS